MTKYKKDPERAMKEMLRTGNDACIKAHNRTIEENVKADPSNPRLEHKASSDACDFCKSQEGTYSQEEIREGQGPQGHKHCKCTNHVSGLGLPRLQLGKTEYNVVTSAINNVYHTRFQGLSSGQIYYGDYLYTFKIKEFNEYKFVKKEEI